MGKAHYIENPELIDRVISEIQINLVYKLGWLDNAYGKAQRLVENRGGKNYYTPNVYAGTTNKKNDYCCVAPDDGLGNFSFFKIDDPQEYDWAQGQLSSLTVKFSLIFWFDFRKIFGRDDVRDIERVKAEILETLRTMCLRTGSITVDTIYEQSESIYKGYNLDETRNQYMMHPYGALRFEGKLIVNESC
jgi:hypothetical protein